MIIIGIDPHKSTHTATALEPATNTDLGSLRIEAAPEECTRLLTWSKTWPQRTWAIENAEGLGHHLAQWLLAAGESVLDIPTNRNSPRPATLERFPTQERPHRRSRSGMG